LGLGLCAAARRTVRPFRSWAGRPSLQSLVKRHLRQFDSKRPPRALVALSVQDGSRCVKRSCVRRHWR
jgi:hypothetical protein